MKNVFFLLGLILALNFMAANSSVWVVNNNDVENADFDQIQTAINSFQVEDGDTLYIQGSTISYGNFTCTKGLTIIGPGYFLNENYLSSNLLNAKVANAYFSPGSEGSIMMGMTIIGNNSSVLEIHTNNITIQRNYLYNLRFSNIQGAIVLDNYIYIGISDRSNTSSFTEVIVLNNIIGSVSTNAASNFLMFDNNILRSNRYRLNSSYFRNNIVLDGSSTFIINSGIDTCNIGTNGLFPDPRNYNVNKINDLFLGGDSPDAKYVLSEDSFAKGKGHNGIDCGVFGGSNPYVLSGLPTIPVITELDTDGIGSKEKGLKVKIGVRAY